jgi:hypothetical protein
MQLEFETIMLDVKVFEGKNPFMTRSQTAWMKVIYAMEFIQASLVQLEVVLRSETDPEQAINTEVLMDRLRDDALDRCMKTLELIHAKNKNRSIN